MSLERKLGVVFFAAVVVRLLFHYLTVFTADDAFITFRYAENIAGGVGYVYNAGEFVQGTTTPLFTFILALFAVFGLPMPTVALGVTLVCSGLTATVIYRYANALRMTRWAGLAAAAYIVFPRSLAADSGGMETALFSLLVITAFYFQYKRLDIYAIGMATLATVTRPEGVLLLGLLLVHNL
ncbi:MAG: hypothetical protein KKA42_13500, partial [candidate division Zixibacteria bacterium]|nr:hypothetical protein [candidate division Zixibacteria bacterium]